MTIKQLEMIGIVWMLAAVIYACKEEKDCATGKVETCPCANGANGIQTCQSDGTWDNCSCTDDCTNDVSSFDTCLDCYCGNEVNTCSGNSDCLDLLSCLSACGTDAECQAACRDDFPEGVTDLVAVLDCRDASCSDFMTDAGCEGNVTDFDTCISCYCTDEINVCEANTDCVDLLNCLNNCTDAACENTCLADFADGEEDLFAVLDCRDRNCNSYLAEPTDCTANVVDFETCLSCYCDDYLTECDAVSDCFDLLYCLDDCPAGDTMCEDDCINNYADGLDPLINVQNCRDDNCADYMS